MPSFLQDNRTTTDLWDSYRSHRDHVMSHLLRGVPGSSLALLGAGNCNDVDIRALLAFYGEVHLFDADAESTSLAVLKQNCPGHPRLYVHAPRDLSGILELVMQWPERTEHSAHEVQTLLEQASAGPGLGRIRPFDVVASTTVLTQLLDLANVAPGEGHAAYAEMVRVLRGAHLRLMINLLAPGGVGILFTDFISSLTLPELKDAPDPELPKLAAAAIARRNFFTGVNPAILQQTLEDSQGLGAQVGRVQLVKPWKWHIADRVYLVYAAKFQRNSL